MRGTLARAHARRPRAAVLGLAALAACLSATAPAAEAGTPAPLPRLTTSQLAGQRVIYSYPGVNPPASLFARIRQGQAAGVIFFGENITSHAQIRGVVRRLQAARRRSPVHTPLLLMTDQEGGSSSGFPARPSCRRSRSARSANPVAASNAGGHRRGQNLRGVGDERQPRPGPRRVPQARQLPRPVRPLLQQQPVHGRAPGLPRSSPPSRRLGVAATAKHFPGLGAATASQNTDEGPVTLQRVAERPAQRRRGALPDADPRRGASW